MTTATERPAPPAAGEEPLIPPPEGPAVLIPPAAMTWEGFRDWATSGAYPERGRVAYIGGGIYVDMSPERYNSHSAVKGEITYVLYQLVRAENLGLFFPDRTLVSNLAADVANEPDAAFASFAALREGRVRLVPTADGADFREVLGTPDMVLEIISPSSVGKDTRLLRERYHLAGIPEYWLIDARGDEIAFAILRHTPDGYAEVEARDGWRPSAVFAREFRLTREATPVPGLWQYTLHVRPPGAA